MNKKSIVIVSLLSMFALALGGCAGDEEEETGESSDELTCTGVGYACQSKSPSWGSSRYGSSGSSRTGASSSGSSSSRDNRTRIVKCVSTGACPAGYYLSMYTYLGSCGFSLEKNAMYCDPL